MSVVFGGGPLASRRTRASIAKASITRLTCRCQPCHERLSLRGGSGKLHSGAEWNFCLTAARMAADQER